MPTRHSLSVALSAVCFRLISISSGDQDAYQMHQFLTPILFELRILQYADTVPIRCFPTVWNACMHFAHTCLILAVNTVYTAVDN